MTNGVTFVFLAQTQGLEDLRGPVILWADWILYAGIAGVLLLIIGLYCFFRYRSRRPKTPEGPRKSPRESAMEALNKLRQDVEIAPPEPFTVKVTDTLRNYLEAAFQIPAREQTSEEFLQALESDRRFPPEVRESLPRFLEQCDLVKFARQSLDTGDKSGLIDQAEDIINLPDPSDSPEPTESVHS